jgi:hypothetical protein
MRSNAAFVLGMAARNLVRLGIQRVLFPVELKANVRIGLGRTTRRFLPCRGRQFSWGDDIKGA